jgi:hypothetical protein
MGIKLMGSSHSSSCSISCFFEALFLSCGGTGELEEEEDDVPYCGIPILFLALAAAAADTWALVVGRLE